VGLDIAEGIEVMQAGAAGSGVRSEKMKDTKYVCKAIRSNSPALLSDGPEFAVLVT